MTKIFVNSQPGPSQIKPSATNADECPNLISFDNSDVISNSINPNIPNQNHVGKSSYSNSSNRMSTVRKK